MTKALFLDRDGVINRELNYVHIKDQFYFNDNIFELCAYYQAKKYKIFVITNQAGIARGFYDEKAYYVLTEWMLDQFRMNGIYIDDVFHCPHHPEFTGECFCRKPKPGLIIRAAEKYDIDLSKSVLIGDKICDVEAGQRAGVGTNFLIPKNKIILKDLTI